MGVLEIKSEKQAVKRIKVPFTRGEICKDGPFSLEGKGGIQLKIGKGKKQKKERKECGGKLLVQGM